MVRFQIGTNGLLAMARARHSVGGMEVSPRDSAAGRRQRRQRRGLVSLLRIPGLASSRQLTLGYELRLRTELAFAHGPVLDEPAVSDDYCLLDEHYCLAEEPAEQPRASDASLSRGA